MSEPTAQRRTRTQVVVVGGGPAGLMLSHLLHRAGIESVVLDVRSVEEIENTHRAGILECNSVELLTGTGVSDRVLTDGDQHRGIELRFDGAGHRIDFESLIGSSCWLYPQTEVFRDLYAARVRDDGDLRFGLAETEIVEVGPTCRVRAVDAEGASHLVDADFVVGADGSRSASRGLVTDPQHYFREYPYAWFGVIVEAERSAPELVYASSPDGFALISQRTDSVQRMYFQCEPDEDPDAWSDDRIWEQLQSRVGGEDGFTLREGPVLERAVLPFRSFVQAPMHEGRLVLAGDAAHTVPPTGAKGLNLALADVQVLADVLGQAVGKDDETLLADYSQRALARVWKAQHFSYWMTQMLHRAPGSSDFDERRRFAELRSVVDSEAGSTYLAESYTGWPVR